MQSEINMFANDIYEKIGEIDKFDDEEVEAAVQRLSEAADDLALLTFDENE